MKNTGSTTVQLANVKVRYYFKADSASASYRFACSWAVKGCANITGTFGTLANPTATADRYPRNRFHLRRRHPPSGRRHQ